MPPFFKKMKIAKKKTHIGIITYHRDANVLASLNGKNSRSYKKATAFVKAIDPQVSLLTRTDRGLQAAYKELFVKKNGDRSSKQNVLLTFTDGRAYPAKRIKPFAETVPPLTVGLVMGILLLFLLLASVFAYVTFRRKTQHLPRKITLSNHVSPTVTASKKN